MAEAQESGKNEALMAFLRKPYLWLFLILVVAVIGAKVALHRQAPDPHWVKDPSPAVVKNATLTILTLNSEIDRIADRYSFNLEANSDAELTDIEKRAKAKGFQFESNLNVMTGDVSCTITKGVPKTAADQEVLYKDVSDIACADHAYLVSVIPLVPQGIESPTLHPAP